MNCILRITELKVFCTSLLSQSLISVRLQYHSQILIPSLGMKLCKRWCTDRVKGGLRFKKNDLAFALPEKQVSICGNSGELS